MTTWLKIRWIRFLAWLNSFDTPEMPLVPPQPEPLVLVVNLQEPIDTLQQVLDELKQPLPSTVTACSNCDTVVNVYDNDQPVKRKYKKRKKVTKTKRKVSKPNARKQIKSRNHNKKSRR